jgi:hypothetical protein
MHFCCNFPDPFLAASTHLDSFGVASSAPEIKEDTISMKRPSITAREALEAWMADEIANIARALPAPKADLLVLDAQMTDLETRCALRQNRIENQLPQPNDAGADTKSNRSNQPKL